MRMDCCSGGKEGRGKDGMSDVKRWVGKEKRVQEEDEDRKRKRTLSIWFTKSPPPSAAPPRSLSFWLTCCPLVPTRRASVSSRA
jgi:antibiotic biosynthesis monooxygenase (ABM) superfamily enzyme